MKLTNEENELLLKKLEYRFKKSNNPIIEKLKNNEELTSDEKGVLLKKLEYRFKKSNNPILEKLSAE